MSDFLTRLAERALGVAPAAEPWVPPRFAQGPDLLDSSSDLPASREAEREESPAVWQRLLEAGPARPAAAQESARQAPQPGTVRILAPPRPRLVPPAPAPPSPPQTAATPPPAETVRPSPSSDLERYVKRSRA
jgi:hypothetical protein